MIQNNKLHKNFKIKTKISILLKNLIKKMTISLMIRFKMKMFKLLMMKSKQQESIMILTKMKLQNKMKI